MTGHGHEKAFSIADTRRVRDEEYGGFDRENSRDIAAGFEGDKGAGRK